LLIDLHGGLTGRADFYYRDEDYKKPGVSLWLTYYNTKTRKFELTDKLRKWKRRTQAVELFGRRRSSSPVSRIDPPRRTRRAGRGATQEYETELAAMAKRREGQLDGADRAEFERKETEWRDKLDNDAAQIKDPTKRLGMRVKIDMVPSH
jgi:hypothetical protein